MKDNELFELCKEVSDVLPEWRYTGRIYSKEGDILQTNSPTLAKLSVPVYTSDYLLEKLPHRIGTPRFYQYLRMSKAEMSYCFAYMSPELTFGIQGTANNPLKALLKLTLALKEAGEL